MNNGKSKKVNRSMHRARAVGGWAKATEYVAKALVAVVGLVVLIIWNVSKD